MHRLLSWMIAPLRNAVMTSAKGYELHTALRTVTSCQRPWILFLFHIMEPLAYSYKTHIFFGLNCTMHAGSENKLVDILGFLHLLKPRLVSVPVH